MIFVTMHISSNLWYIEKLGREWLISYRKNIDAIALIWNVLRTWVLDCKIPGSLSSHLLPVWIQAYYLTSMNLSIRKREMIDV